MIKCFTKNKNGKIEFTQAELEKLLNEIYKAGYDDANNKHYWWSSPYYYSTTPYYSYSTTAADVSTGITVNSCNTITCNTVNPEDYIKVVC